MKNNNKPALEKQSNSNSYKKITRNIFSIQSMRDKTRNTNKSNKNTINQRFTVLF